MLSSDKSCCKNSNSVKDTLLLLDIFFVNCPRNLKFLNLSDNSCDEVVKSLVLLKPAFRILSQDPKGMIY